MACLGCITAQSTCPQRPLGECVAYSGAFIIGPSIANGDSMNTALLKLSNYVSAQTSGVVAPSLPLFFSGGVLGIYQASSIQNGFLSSTDWSTFNTKLTTVSTSSPIFGNGTPASPINIVLATALEIPFSTTVNTSYIYPAGYLTGGFTLKSTANMTLNIGTTPSGGQLVSNLPILANQTVYLQYGVYTDVATTIYFTGVAGGTLTITPVLRKFP